MQNQQNPIPQRILSVIEDELNRIILDVHDGPVQNLFAALSTLMQVQYEIEARAPESPTLLPRINAVIEMVEGSLHEIKFFLGTFRSPEFKDRPLYRIIDSLIVQHEEWTEHTIELTVEELPEEIALPIKIAFYRIVQEALSNAFRHAGVDKLWVKFWTEDKMLCLQVRDEGRGFEPPPMEGPQATELIEHVGLRGMRERVALIGGEFHIDSQLGKGTTIQVKVPIYE